jgi:hypothetical protein
MNPVVDKAGNKFWYNNDKSIPYITKWQFSGNLHRLDGPAIEWINGDEEWFINGKKHRINGPAIKCVNGHNEWYVNDELHRLDGPAVELSSGVCYWYIQGKQIDCQNSEEFLRIVKMKTLL